MADELRAQLQTLSDAHARIRSLRQIPAQVLHKGTANFSLVREIGVLISRDDVQSALHRGRESLKGDPTQLHTQERSKKHTVRRPRTPSPAVIEMEEIPEDLELDQLGGWARVYNESHVCKLRIQGQLLRYTIPDVMKVHMSIGAGPRVVVETIRAFGPREEQAAHGHSGYGVYQAVSQYLGGVIEGPVPFPALIRQLEAYSDMFISPCSVCGRVVSGEIPAVVRWFSGQERKCRHVGCSYE